MSGQMSLFPSQDLPKEDSAREKDLNALDEMFAASRRYRSSLEYMELLRFISRFPNYSTFNCFLLHVQDPSISYVATAGKWRKHFKRHLKPNARPLVILAPMSPVRFVFDLKDTEGEHIPPAQLRPFDAMERIQKDIYDKTLHNCEVHGIAVRTVDLAHTDAGGAIPLTYNVQKQFKHLDLKPQMKYLVLLEESHTREKKYASLAYELGHIFGGHLGIDDKAWWQDRRGTHQALAEIEAESVAFLVCRRKGLLKTAEKYLTAYVQQDKEMPVFGLNAVLSSIHYIEEMGKSRWKRPKKKSRYLGEKSP
ncbi:hypothetical protein ACFL0O_07085 [Thermodesulfobacteriota bacterium]